MTNRQEQRVRVPIVGANWKMNKTVAQSLDYVRQLRSLLVEDEEDHVFLLMPFTALLAVKQLMEEWHCRIALGAQDVYWEEWGAYTGEVSAPMLEEIGCRCVLVGHCERRRYFGETDETVNRKVKAVLPHVLTPIVCIGETLDEREGGLTEQKIRRQVSATLDGLTTEQVRQCIIAYEPVWAIGTDRTAAVEQAEEVHTLIRRLLTREHGEAAREVAIVYGGSVHLDDCVELARGGNIDGVFVGRDSLDAVTFARIIRAVCGSVVERR